MGSSSACHDFAAEDVESPLLLPVSRSNHNGDPAQRRPVVAATRHARPDVAPLAAPSTARTSCLLTLGRSLFLLINIGAWYFTNGLNGIAMQSYSADLVKSREDDTVEHLPLAVAMLATLVVSSLQLMAGAILGLLLIYLQLLLAGETQHFATEVQETLGLFPHGQALTILGLSLLHAGGSFCTNAGFMFGKASLIQTIKLLEPFKTLMFAKLLAPEEGKLVTIGVLCSITTTVMAAISLVQSYSTPPNPLAIFFAVNSGLLLSCRNVLQRREHNLKPDSSSSPTETGTVSIVRHDTKLKKSLQQFTRLSLRSGLLLSLVAAIARILSLFLDTNPYATFHVGEQYTWGMVIWHPLYNAFSMITLGYTSAVTHALLNAGKRVFAILLALVWFGEDVSPVTCTALVLVLIGGFWYTHETKAAASAQKISSSPLDGATSKAAARAGWWKAVIAAVLLHSLAIARLLEPAAKA
jgi:Triose-phosphate Transporter family